jgi:hypothetical protein
MSDKTPPTIKRTADGNYELELDMSPETKALFDKVVELSGGASKDEIFARAIASLAKLREDQESGANVVPMTRKKK